MRRTEKKNELIHVLSCGIWSAAITNATGTRAKKGDCDFRVCRLPFFLLGSLRHRTHNHFTDFVPLKFPLLPALLLFSFRFRVHFVALLQVAVGVVGGDIFTMFSLCHCHSVWPVEIFGSFSYMYSIDGLSSPRRLHSNLLCLFTVFELVALYYVSTSSHLFYLSHRFHSTSAMFWFNWMKCIESKTNERKKIIWYSSAVVAAAAAATQTIVSTNKIQCAFVCERVSQWISNLTTGTHTHIDRIHSGNERKRTELKCYDNEEQLNRVVPLGRARYTASSW